ncbi:MULTISPECIES: DUF7512 family protein [Halobacteriales]|nr:hypothetical protein SAMN05444342_4294 [Haladaptatus paucihalophilus DX253]
MFGIETLSSTSQAAAQIGLVLAESIVLYVGYGALTQAVGPTVLDTLGGE